jgi:glucose-6-phosphate 1-dehydrogenase
MEPPRSGDGNAIRDKSAEVLNNLRPPQAEDVVLGQYAEGKTGIQRYPAYRREAGVSDDSVTETYVALRAFIDSPRWQGVPFYLRTGKRLDERCAEIKILFRKQALRGLMGQEEANMLIIRIQPDEGIALSFNVRKPGESNQSESVLMDFCHHCHFGPNTPEAYEAILSSVLTGDTLPFTRWDWLQASWRYIDQLKAVAPPPVLYPAGSSGPQAADLLLGKDGRQWL